MPFCGCSSSTLASLTFGDGIVLVRCAAHESQTWMVDGVPSESADVLADLRAVFVERRGTGLGSVRRGTGVPPAHAAGGRAHVPAAAAPVDRATADEQLTALLQSRGLSGSWSVA